jgi:integrase
MLPGQNFVGGSVSLSRLLTRVLAALPPVHVEPISLEAWAAEVDHHYQPACKSTRLRAGQATRLALQLSPPGSTTLDLTPELVAKVAAHESGTLRPATIDGRLRALRAACTLAVLGGHLVDLPFGPRTPWPALKSVQPLKSRHHSRDALAKLLAGLAIDSGSWEGGRLHALAAVWLYCGLRKSEALRMRVEDLDFGLGILWVIRRVGRTLKTVGSEAAVPMPGPLSAILLEWAPRCGSGWLFPGCKLQGPWTGGTTGRKSSDRLKQAAESAGISGVTPHTLRHSLATHLRGFWGLSPKQIQMILRHSNQYTQELYCHEDLANLGSLVREVSFSPPCSSAG